MSGIRAILFDVYRGVRLDASTNLPLLDVSFRGAVRVEERDFSGGRKSEKITLECSEDDLLALAWLLALSLANYYRFGPLETLYPSARLGAHHQGWCVLNGVAAGDFWAAVTIGTKTEAAARQRWRAFPAYQHEVMRESSSPWELSTEDEVFSLPCLIRLPQASVPVESVCAPRILAFCSDEAGTCGLFRVLLNVIFNRESCTGIFLENEAGGWAMRPDSCDLVIELLVEDEE